MKCNKFSRKKYLHIFFFRSLSLSILRIALYRTHFLVTGYTPSFHPTLQSSTKARRPRCHGNLIFARTTNFRCYPCAKGPSSEKKSGERCRGLDIGRNSRRKARFSRKELFEIESYNVVTTHPFASLSTLPGLYFSCLSPVFSFFPSSVFFSSRPESDISYVQARNFR